MPIVTISVFFGIHPSCTAKKQVCVLFPTNSGYRFRFVVISPELSEELDSRIDSFSSGRAQVRTYLLSSSCLSLLWAQLELFFLNRHSPGGDKLVLFIGIEDVTDQFHVECAALVFLGLNCV